MIALKIYLFTTFILATLICLRRVVLAKRHGYTVQEVENRGFTLVGSLIFIIFASLTVPWFIVEFMRTLFAYLIKGEKPSWNLK